MSRTPEYDVVVAVHTPARPVDRAIASVVDHTDADVRVTVVCHGVDPAAIQNRLGNLAAHDRVRLIAHDDGLHSAAGPFNAGLDAATAPFVSVLGSDDQLEPHAVDSWLRVQRTTSAAVVIPRLAFASGLRARTPLARPLRSRRLDPVRDRLSYRTAQLGLVSRERFPNLRFAEGIATGEDVPYGLQLWFSGAPIALDRSGPAYFVHDDRNGDRTTLERRAVAEEFAFLPTVIGTSWFGTLPARSRRAIATKLLRAHLVPSTLRRAGATDVADDLAALAEVRAAILGAAPGAELALSIRDARVIEALGGDRTALRTAASSMKTSVIAPARLLTRHPTRLLDRESPVRLLGAAVFSPS